MSHSPYLLGKGASSPIPMPWTESPRPQVSDKHVIQASLPDGRSQITQ